MKTRIFNLIVFIVYFSCPINGQGLTVLSPEELKGSYQSGPLNLQPRSFDIQGELIAVNTGCSFSYSKMDLGPEINGKIVLFPGECIYIFFRKIYDMEDSF